MKKRRAFVFVVCGSEVYLNELNFSYKFLSNRTNLPIYVITDTNRNEVELEFRNVIDVKTPDYLNNHQASIFLKTSLIHYLPQDMVYFYLDTDVIAVSKNIDSIFNEFKQPIIFAKDLSTIDEFSPFAMKCGCIERRKKEEMILSNAKKQNQTLRNQVIDEINQITKKNKSSRLRYIKSWIKYHFSFDNKYFLSDKYYLDKTSKEIFTNQNKSAYVINVLHNKKFDFIDVDKMQMKPIKCEHLRLGLKQKFNVKKITSEFQQWNGGVFLFSSESEAFLNDWHSKSMSVFKDDNWVDRDQGALIATVFSFNLQSHKCLPEKYNLIIKKEKKLKEIGRNTSFLHFIDGFDLIHDTINYVSS